VKEAQRQQNQIVEIDACKRAGRIILFLNMAAMAEALRIFACQHIPGILYLLSSARIAFASVFSPFAEMLLRIFLRPQLIALA